MTTAEEKLEPGWSRREVVCTYAVELKGGKGGMMYLVIPEDGGSLSEAREFCLDRKGIKGAGPGDVYSVPMNAELSKMRVATARFSRTYPKADEVAFWWVKHDAQIAREREAKMAKDGKTASLAKAMEALEPLKIAHRGTDRWGKVVIEALVLQYLRGA